MRYSSGHMFIGQRTIVPHLTNIWTPSMSDDDCEGGEMVELEEFVGGDSQPDEAEPAVGLLYLHHLLAMLARGVLT